LKLPALLLLCFMFHAAALAAAYADQSDPKQNNERVFDLDAPPKPSIRLTDELRFGINALSEFMWEDNFDLDNREPDDKSVIQPSVEIAFRYVPIEKISAFVDFEVLHEIVEKETGDDEREREEKTKLQVKQVYVLFDEVIDGLDLKVGRQRFKDEREWLYDEELDGVRLFYGFWRLGLDLSASVKNDPDLLHGWEEDEITNYAAFFNYCPIDDNIISAFAFYRHDRSDEEERPIFYGVSLVGEAVKHLEYWAELASVDGKSGDDDIRGFGGDAGATYTFKLPLRPSITVGYAFGTGDDDPSDDVDENFRQTGLQDNDAAFAGITRFKYYGEAFDPELSNMGIATAGIGIKPNRSFSLDLVYHYYHQHELSDEIRDVEIEMDPSGLERELGHEIDLIVGYRTRKHFRASVAVGYFLPGDAFPDDADEALFGEVKLQVFF